MALELGVAAQGDDVASRHLTILAKRGEDPRPAFRTIQDDMRAAETQWIGSGGAGTWPKLAESTRATKARKRYPATAMVATKALQKSLTVKRGKGAIRSATKRQMKFGTKVYYAQFHEGGHGVPTRRVLIPVDAKARRRMVRDVRDYMMGKGKAP